MAIAYIRENADEFFVDPRHVAAVGFSAGGHLCGTLATLYDDENVLKLIGKRRVSFRPDAVIMSYAVSYNSHGGTFNNISAKNDDLKKYLTVIDRVNESSSPAFIWHTRQDELVPVDNALKLALAYHKANVPFALHIYDKGAHGLSTATEEVANSAKSTAISDEVSTWVDLAYMWLKNSLGFKIIHSADKD